MESHAGMQGFRRAKHNPIRAMKGTTVVLAILWVAVWLVPSVHGLQQAQLMPLWLHSLLEMFAVSVAMLLFGVVWNAYSKERSGSMVLIGCAFLAVGLLDIGHILSYKGMPDFITPSGTPKGINFWLAGRLVAALTLLVVALRPWKPLADSSSRYLMLGGSLALTALIFWLGLFHQDLWPETFIEGRGLTHAKVFTEYLIIVILVVAAAVFYLRAQNRPGYDAAAFFSASVISALSEFCFTSYTGVHDIFNLLGHGFKIAAYLFLYRAAFVASVRAPFRQVHIEVAERKAAEEALRVLNQSLEVRVAQRTLQLEQANKELEAFSYSVSHDLRAPLRAIDGFGQILDKNYSEVLDARGHDYLARIRRASQRMGNLIDDMLHLAQISRKEVVRTTVDVTALTHTVAADVAHDEAGRDVAIVIADCMRVEADSQLIRIVLENLLGNAWKFTRRTPAARIEVGMLKDVAGPVIFVRDNGAGFSMEYAHKLFSPFQRLHNSSEFEGSGIGLATVQRIIHRHGGRVWAESSEGKGATFYFSCGPQAMEAREAKHA